MSYTSHRSEESVEDYLETILILSHKKQEVRSVDVAAALGYSKPSVSVAMKNLRAREYVTVSHEGYISFTETGRKLAENVYEKHTILAACLMELGVDEETAMADACRIEHDLSEKSFQALKAHFNKRK